MEIISLIHKAMEEKGMTEQAIADETGIPQPTVHRIVTGKTQKVDATKLQKIKDALSIGEKQQTYAVTEVYEGLSDTENELIDYFRALCSVQKVNLLGVASAMAAGVPVKSKSNGNPVVSLLDKRLA